MTNTEDSKLITLRRQVYGDPEETFIRIAQVWSGIIGHEIQSVEVPLMMEGMKLVRTQICPDYSDNSDDIVGYNDIFRLLMGEDMIHARSVDEYITIKKRRLQHPPLSAAQENDMQACITSGLHISGQRHTLTECPTYS